MNGQVQLSHPVLVVGAGAAGISAGLWLHDRRIPFQWFERSNVIGGTLLRVGNPIDELIGIDAPNGPALVEHFSSQLKARDLAPSFHTNVVSLRAAKDFVDVDFELGGLVSERRFAAVVVATGTQPRTLGIPLENELWGNGVEISVTRKRQAYVGERVAVVGGGDAALEGALLLAEVCRSVTLIHRREKFRAQARFIDAVNAHPAIEIRVGVVEELLTTGQGNTRRLEGVKLGSGERISATGLFVRLGVDPTFPTGTIGDGIKCGDLPCDAFGRTDQPRVYVAGDISASHFQSVSWCAGSAGRAISTLCHDLGIVTS